MSAPDTFNPTQTGINNVAAVNGTALNLRGGYIQMRGEATWGGGSMKLQQQSPYTGTWFDLGGNFTMTANNCAGGTVPEGIYRIVTTGGIAAAFGDICGISARNKP